MRERTIVVIGGALAGPTAAARARETDDKARIVLLERARDISYAVGGLAYHLSGEVPRVDDLNRERAQFFRDVYGIDARTGVEVRGIEARKREVVLDGERIAYDALIHALGAASQMPAIPGLADAANVFHFRTLIDLEAIVRRLDGGARRIAIVGGGFFGIEAADGFLRRGCHATVIEKGARVLSSFEEPSSRLAAEALVRAGGEVLTGAEVVAAERAGSEVSSLMCKDGTRVPCDLVVVCGGLRPRTELLKRAGARLAPDGTVMVDDRCRTSLSHVYACGVGVSLPHAVSKQRIWFAQAAQADKTAQVAGANAAGGRAKLGAVLGTAIVRAGDLVLARTGLGRVAAAKLGKSRLGSVTVHASARDAYLTGATPVTIDLLFDRKTGVVLGAEAVGREGVDKRIDVLATAIAGKLPVERIAQLDLAYAPPFSCARDPVNVAATVAAATRGAGSAGIVAEQLARRLKSYKVVDVRRDVAGGSIAGATHLPLGRLRADVKQLPRGKVVFLDDTGRHAYLAARIARQRGRGDVDFLSGGLGAWQASGRPLAPLVTGTRPAS